MNIYNLKQDLVFINQLGVTINTEERLKLEIILFKLLENNKFQQLLFWGKIEGTKKDYYIAMGLNFKGFYEFPQKRFFYSTSDFKDFQELPELNMEYTDQVENIRSVFSGVPETILIQAKAPEVEQKTNEEVDSDDEQPKAPPSNFNELDRLSYTVRGIEVECQVVPIGAFKLTQEHELNYNTSFPGLSVEQAHDINQYQHFRNASTQEYKDRLMRDQTIFTFDFMEPLTQDLPQGCWSLQSSSNRSQVTLRSLLWMGYVAYHQANTNRFGGIYIGNGLKNTDLPFQFA